MSGTAAAPADAQKDALLGLFNRLWNDPEKGADIRRRAKELHPEITIPDEHPAALAANKRIDELSAQTSALQKMLDERAQSDAQREAESRLRDSLGKAQSRFKLTDEGMAGTIKLMQERQIADPEAAAALYVDSLPKNAPAPATSMLPGGKFNLFGTTAKDDAWEKLHVDPDGYFADVVNQVFSELPPAA